MGQKLAKFIITLLILLYPFSSPASTFSRPPSTINLKLPPPKNESEAFKRIPDFIILNTILPPVIDRKKLMKQVFGKYTSEIRSVLTKEKIKELSLLTASKMKSKRVSLSDLKQLILSKINLKTSNQSHAIFLPVLIGIITAIVVPLITMFVLIL